MKRLAIVLAAVFLAGCARQPCPPTPTHVCKRTVDAIKIDGVLDEQSWQKAEPLKLTLREGTGEPKFPTTMKVMWDDKMLYVAFECVDPDVWATMTERDDKLWEQEVVEVFLDPTGTGNPYFEYEVNPLNTVVDLRFVKDIMGMAARGLMWNSKGLKTAVVVHGSVETWKVGHDADGKWTVEMGIPFDDLDSLPNSPPKEGDKWRANFYRIERPAALQKEDDEYSCWSPICTSPSFHTLDRFGTLIFSMKPVGS